MTTQATRYHESADAAYVNLGWQTGTVGETSLLARLPGRVVLADGAAVRLAVDAPIHLFDAATGRRQENVVTARETVGA